MSLTVAELIKLIDDLAPPGLAEEWDNVGLQLGDLTQNVHRVLVSLDVDERVIDEAISKKADMIISHHPMIFHPVKSILYHHPLGKEVCKLIKNDISVFSAHTNLDIAPGGINDFLAELFNLAEVELLAETKEDKLLKLVVFVPSDYLAQVRNSISEAGAGHIGQYSHCTFAAPGEGTFLPLDGTNPFMGEQGKIEKTAEYRLETIVPVHMIKPVLEAMIKSHPYEEVAYDIYPTALEGTKYGLGRVGNLSRPVSLEKFAGIVKETLGINALRVVGDENQVISRVAVCGGGGMSLLSAARKKGAQCLITGDLKYHEGQNALAQGIAVIDAGHYATEALFIPKLSMILKNKLAICGVGVLTSKINTNPWVFY